MPGYLSRVIGWLANNFIRKSCGSKSLSDAHRKDFASYILRHGSSVPEKDLDLARGLGVDVDALIATHERNKAASWEADLNIDLATCRSSEPGLEFRLAGLGIPQRTLESRGADLRVSLPGLSTKVGLPTKTMQLAELISLGIQAAFERFQKSPGEFPANLYPFGLSDMRFTRLGWSEAESAWFLTGWWKPDVQERKPSKLNPEQSIDLRRFPSHQKQLISAEPLPELKQVTLSVWRWPGGKHVVMSVFANEQDAPPFSKSSHEGGADTLRMAYPSGGLPTLEWEHNLFNWRTPCTHFLERQFLIQAGKTPEWLDPFSVEAVFANQLASNAVTDLRASLVSGPMGPAPLPEGGGWPVCPCCGEPALFSQSLDMRDIGFADMLPGSTMVIFVCNECHRAGEWLNCAKVIWLRREEPVVMIDRGDSMPLAPFVQWYGPDTKAMDEIPEEVSRFLAELEEGSPHSCISPSYGTKAGGVPCYLQSENIFYDRNGCVMEYIAQIGTPDHIIAGGFGYIFHSTTTGETFVQFQDT